MDEIVPFGIYARPVSYTHLDVYKRQMLDVGYIYNTESFIVGSIAKILLHPRLYLTYDR